MVISFLINVDFFVVVRYKKYIYRQVLKLAD